MMRKVCIAVLLHLVLSTTCQSPTGEKLIIGVSANMQFAIDELVQSFSESTGIECEAVISSSGKLTAQIMEGAPIDILVSADMNYPTELYKMGYSTEPQIYAYGKLILWTTKEGMEPTIDLLSRNEIKHIAIANPKLAPYGIAAVQTLKYYELYKEVMHKLVFGESVAQTNQFIISGAAEMGFTSKSVVLSKGVEETGKWIELDPQAYSPIAQGVVIINGDDKQVELASKFQDFLFSATGKEILNKFGYSVNEQ